MMKSLRKLLAIVLCAAFCFALASCGSSEVKEPKKKEPASNPKITEEKSDKKTEESKSSVDFFEWGDDDIIEGLTDEGKEQKNLVIPAKCKGILNGVFITGVAEKITFEDDDDIELPLGAFLETSTLKEIKLPANLSVIPEMAFSGCENLTEIVIPAGVTTIGDSAFAYCDGLTDVTFAGNSVTAIGKYAFQRCTALQKVVLPEGLKEIGGSAFFGCKAITDITLPASIEKLGSIALGDKTSGVTIHVKSGSWADANRDQWDSAYENIAAE